MKLSKIFVFVCLFILLTTSVSAWTKYDQLINPYPVGGHIIIAGLELQDVKVEVCNLRTEYCQNPRTNNNGDFVVSLDNFMVPDSIPDKYLPPYLVGDEITIKVCDGVPECTHSFNVLGSDMKGYTGNAFFQFIVGSEPEDIEKRIETEKIIKIPEDDVVVDHFDNEVKPEELEQLSSFGWFRGMIVGIFAFLAGLGLAGRKRLVKTYRTILERLRSGRYDSKGKRK